MERKDLTELKPLNSTRDRPPRFKLTIVLVTIAVTIIVLFVQIPPSSLLGKSHLIGYGICHRIPERSFELGDGHFPLCARCTGTFLGAIVGLAAMLVLRRHRASRMAPVPVLAVLVMFVGFWGFDGLNSYLTFFPNVPNLYEPQNWLRLTTGLLNGLALVIFVFPIFTFTLWRDTVQEPAIKSLWEMLAIMPVIVLLILALHSGIDLLLYPLAILSSLGVLLMLVMVNTMLATVVLGREAYALKWYQALVPLSVGTALAILEIVGMVLMRAYLTTQLGLPF